MIPVFEWTISLGQVGSALASVITVVWVFAMMRGDIRIIQQDIEYIQKKQTDLTAALLQLGTILTKIAVQDTRLAMVDKSIDELRHGQGYIKQRKQGNNNDQV